MIIPKYITALVLSLMGKPLKMFAKHRSPRNVTRRFEQANDESENQIRWKMICCSPVMYCCPKKNVNNYISTERHSKVVQGGVLFQSVLYVCLGLMWFSQLMGANFF